MSEKITDLLREEALIIEAEGATGESVDLLIDAADEITTLRQQLAEVTGCACSSEGPCKYHAMTSVSGRSYVLRKQAEAVEAAMKSELSTFRLHSGTKRSGCFAQDLSAYAQRLRQQADEAERAGGEK